MFRITNNAMTPHKATFTAALERLPVAHREAQLAGLSHLHAAAIDAVEEAGLNSAPVVIGHRNGHPYLGIEYGPAGDRLADVEYGTPDDAANPIIRTAATSARPAAEALYRATLRQRMGL